MEYRRPEVPGWCGEIESGRLDFFRPADTDFAGQWVRFGRWSHDVDHAFGCGVVELVMDDVVAALDSHDIIGVEGDKVRNLLQKRFMRGDATEEGFEWCHPHK